MLSCASGISFKGEFWKIGWREDFGCHSVAGNLRRIGINEISLRQELWDVLQLSRMDQPPAAGIRD